VTPGLTLGTLYSSGVGINKTKQHYTVCIFALQEPIAIFCIFALQEPIAILFYWLFGEEGIHAQVKLPESRPCRDP